MLENDKQIAPINPYLVVDNIDQAAEYYFQAYGARQAERYEDHNGKVWYAVFKIFGTPLQLMEPDDAMGLTSRDPGSDEPDALAVTVSVSNVDKSYNRVLKAGGEALVEPQDAEWGGRTAEVRDPFGFRWILGPRLRKKDRRRSPLAPQVVVEDVDEAVGFWQRVLGAKEARRIKGTVRPEVPFTVIRLGGAALQLTAPDPAKGLAPVAREGRKGGDNAMVTVTVKDVDSVFERAIEAGGIPIVEPQDAYWGDRYAEFRDIAGLRVSSCGESSLADRVINPADLQARLDEFLNIHGQPSSPAGPVGVQNVGP